MAIICRKSPFWAAFPDSASTRFCQGWWIFTKFGMVKTDICKGVSWEGRHFTSIQCNIKSGHLKLKKPYFCCFQQPSLALKAVNPLFLIYFSPDFKRCFSTFFNFALSKCFPDHMKVYVIRKCDSQNSRLRKYLLVTHLMEQYQV